MPEQQRPAGGAELQRARLHRLPLADRALGPLHRRPLVPRGQRICRPQHRRTGPVLHGNADPQGHLRPGQRGTGATKEVRCFCSIRTSEMLSAA